MTDSPTTSPSCSCSCNTHEYDQKQEVSINSNNINIHENQPQIVIPVEIITDEEMGLIDAAFTLATKAARRPPSSIISAASLRSCTSTSLHSNSNSNTNSNSISFRQFSNSDVEDLGLIKSPHYHNHNNDNNKMKKMKFSDSLLSRFRNNRALSVTDFTSTEWCEKQMEFFLSYGRPEKTTAMKAGITRHAKLEEEVSKKVEVRVETFEDIWALKFMNFVICANQLLFDGLTREIPVVGFVQGVWMVGVIDELRMPVTGDDRKLTLVDTKTRVQSRPPSEPQRRNGRLQLMCYKYLLDNLLSDNFPSEQFYEYFSMDPQHVLSDGVKMSATNSGFPAETLGELEKYFSNACSMLPSTHDQLLLRYELQEDNSLLYEDEFTYNEDWLKAQMNNCLEFWRGEREAKYVSETENWKCRFCNYAKKCYDIQIKANSQSSICNNGR